MDKLPRFTTLIAVLIVLVMLVTTLAPSGVLASGDDAVQPPAELMTNKESPDSWIVKWNSDIDPDFWHETALIAHKETLGVSIVRPLPHVDAREWATRWENEPGVAYVQPNQRVEVLALPNDEYFSAQSNLRQIRANVAWDLTTGSKEMTIALIDTGVDLTHPDLRGNLVEGVNLIKPGEPPRDDHGHGTNVAGVVAAVGNNKIGVSGVAWSANIMPIKALEADGLGDEDKLGEGIRYAVDNGANIIVMSVGLHRYSPFLQEIVNYAEEKGVLLISATGNEGSEVKYPAAYPTVLAVGGVAQDNQVMLESNYGAEVDLVAPWEVFTTAINSDYEYNQGTSMAAPQVAGAAALAWAKYPNLTPQEIRNYLRQTAQDIEAPGWDMYAGYGMLRIDRLLSEPYRTDMYEPNDTREQAKRLPLDTMIYGELRTSKDTDWFYIEPAYRGTAKLTLAPMKDTEADLLPKVTMTYYPADGSRAVVYNDVLRQPPTLPLKMGKGRVSLQYAEPESNKNTIFPYKLLSEFTIYRDNFEDNDRQFKAYNIPKEVQSLTGTFHQVNDQDWFAIDVQKTGSLQLSVSASSMRIDVAVMVQKSGEKAYFLDQKGEGGTETMSSYDVTPGRYYILLNNVISDNAYPVKGEYTLDVQITPKLIDPNEPNDKSFMATQVVSNTEYRGLFDKSTDQDWFSFTLTGDSYVSMNLKGIPQDRLMLMTLFDAKQTQLQLNMNTLSERTLAITKVLQKGTYYVKLGTNRAFAHQLYTFTVNVEPLVSGFRDIKGHWAEKSIVALVKDKVLTGYGDATFRPNRALTRAEAVAILVKAFGYSGGSSIAFSDIETNHWARSAIRAAVHVGMVSGYSDGTFRPDQPVSRAEVSAMVAKAMGLKETTTVTGPFSDMKADHWASGWVSQLVAKKVLSGYQDGSFKPDNLITRGEMSTMTAKATNR